MDSEASLPEGVTPRSLSDHAELMAAVAAVRAILRGQGMEGEGGGEGEGEELLSLLPTGFIVQVRRGGGGCWLFLVWFDVGAFCVCVCVYEGRGRIIIIYPQPPPPFFLNKQTVPPLPLGRRGGGGAGGGQLPPLPPRRGPVAPAAHGQGGGGRAARVGDALDPAGMIERGGGLFALLGVYIYNIIY